MPTFYINIKYFYLLTSICACYSSSNFGVLLVFPSKEKLVAASEVVAVGPQPRPTMETVIITLMHLALHSEKIEFEVYMLTFFI